MSKLVGMSLPTSDNEMIRTKAYLLGRPLLLE